MPGNNDPAAATDTHQEQEGRRSCSPSSSASSSPRVAAYVDHEVFDSPTGSAAAASTSAAEPALKPPTSSHSAAAPDTEEEDPDPYPLWQRPSIGTQAAKSSRSPSAPSPTSPSSSSSTSPRVVAPSSSSSSLLLTAPAPLATPNPNPPGAEAVHARKTAPCQYPGCSRHAKYGEKDETPTACQAHKRTGQFTTNRHGELLKATRDGDAFRTPSAPLTNPHSASTGKGTARQRVPHGGGKHSSGRKAEKPSSYAQQGVKRKNRPGLSSADDEGSPASSQNRSCLFPGCDARPVYGLAVAARPVYCFSHKKGPMVQLVKEAPALHDKRGASQSAAAAAVARESNAGESRMKPPAAVRAAALAAAAAERKKQRSRAPPDTVSKNRPKKARRVIPKDGDDSSDADGEEQHTKKGRAKFISGKNDIKNDRAAGASKTARKVVDLTQPSDNGRGASSSSTGTAVSSPRPSATTTTRMGDISGMAPSAEILLLQQAREEAKREAEAGGGGRRARAPSRRALEASGRMPDQSAQWMTQERKEEQARAALALREQRKRYKAAGLKFGVVLEEFVVGKVEAEAVVVTEAAGGGASGGGGGGGGSRGGGNGRAGSPPVVAGWRKVSPVALSVPREQAVAQEKAARVVAAGERR